MVKSRGRVVETELRVRYAETDAMGIVHHSNYLIWFEAGRSDYLFQQGHSYAEIEEEGFHLPVAEAYVRFMRPALYGDLVVIRTWVEELGSRKVTFGYEAVRQSTNEILANGYTKHICTNSDGQIVIIPQKMRDLLRQ
ncbi:MAG: acyl-CoA thioesterase [Anaerolineae bacterium]